MRIRPVLLPLVVAAVAATVAGCKPSAVPKKASAPPSAPILLFGADGFEWNVALPLIRRGRLPTIASLMERGTYGQLATHRPTRSPIIWTSVATGKTPDKHGIEDFVYRDSANPEELNLFTSADRRTKAFWNILTDYGRTVGVVGWWMTFPVEKINGVMVAQTNTLDQLRTVYAENIWKGTLLAGIEGQVYPPKRQDEMMDVLQASERELASLTEEIFGTFKHPQSELTRRLWDNCRWAFRADATYINIAKRLISAEDRPEVLAVYMGGPDVVGHRYWRYMFPDRFEHRPTDAELEDYGGIITDYYEYTDQCLGQLMEAYGADVTVIVASDHGMRAGNVTQMFDPVIVPANVNSGEHRGGPPGVVVLAGPRFRRTPLSKPLAELNKDDLPLLCSIYDITPTILALLGIPLGEDMDGHVVTQAIEPEWLEKYPLRTVGSHDTVAWLEARPQTKLQSPNKQARLEQLRALGYFK